MALEKRKAAQEMSGFLVYGAAREGWPNSLSLELYVLPSSGWLANPLVVRAANLWS